MKPPFPQRVLYVVSLFPCWSETFIVREIATLVAQGVDVRILSLKHPHEAMVQPDAEALMDRAWHPQPRGTAWSQRWAVLFGRPLTMLSLLAQRWMEATASAAVTGVPSENFRPGRRVKLHSLPSLLVLYFSTIWGLGTPLSSRPNSMS